MRNIHGFTTQSLTFLIVSYTPENARRSGLGVSSASRSSQLRCVASNSLKLTSTRRTSGRAEGLYRRGSSCSAPGVWRCCRVQIPWLSRNISLMWWQDWACDLCGERQVWNKLKAKIRQFIIVVCIFSAGMFQTQASLWRSCGTEYRFSLRKRREIHLRRVRVKKRSLLTSER